MKASVLSLDRKDFDEIRKNNQGVFDAYTIHKIVYSLFPKQTDKTRDFLFVYQGGDYYEKRILIFSREDPKEPQYGTIETKDIPQAFLEQNYYGFTVQMNPVKREKTSGKIVPIRGRDELIDWFTQKSASFGFEVLADSLSVGDTDVIQFEKDNKKVVLGKAVFTGRLKVTDRKLFCKSFEEGIGKGKAFGFGLLQIIPLQIYNN